MKKSLKVVFDTNVLVSSLYSAGLCNELFRRNIRGEFTAIISGYILKEFQKNAGRFLSNKSLSRASKLIRKAFYIIEDEKIHILKGIVKSDSSDDPIVSCAATVKADYLVTGDKEILKLRTFEEIRIVSPRDFMAILDSSGRR